MGVAGNSASSDERRRLEIALRSHDADRVLSRARDVPDLQLSDALTITAYLAREGDRRFDRAAGRLVGRLLTERPLRLEDADVALELAGRLPDPAAVAQLRGYVEGGGR
jgi:hypothetical protein